MDEGTNWSCIFTYVILSDFNIKVSLHIFTPPIHGGGFTATTPWFHCNNTFGWIRNLRRIVELSLNFLHQKGLIQNSLKKLLGGCLNKHICHTCYLSSRNFLGASMIQSDSDILSDGWCKTTNVRFGCFKQQQTWTGKVHPRKSNLWIHFGSPRNSLFFSRWCFNGFYVYTPEY